ncbi:HpcH/HpaI aldolase/citrate lyase family protein [Cellulosimicrobium marinum]|uniref:HpcH/HpaI aldolase/citrate lyase family protein n=1 Tax=Cellulosimicrobium marinum TaxID=1638992 RepID=UPI001E299CC8|nr:CoA ester lyase [Cellulosimicrobium marinum]MCB7135638.1 CoA ester lyase [Cellulosimicrobium marinum]
MSGGVGHGGVEHGPFPLGPALLFCPADRPDRYAKAAERADAVILDLEDAVAPAAKDAARRAVVEASATLDPARTVVRVNAVGTAAHALDVAALADTRLRTVMVAKAGPELLDSLPALAATLPGVRVVALCETAAGVLAAPELARRAEVVALMWGAEDLVASLGGTSSRRADGTYRDVARHARASVLLAAGAAGKAAVDAVHVDIADLDGLRAEAEDAAASGFTASACIHPSHVPVLREAYAPTAEQVRDARALLDAAVSNPGGPDAVFTLDGRMVDAPVLRHAESVLRRAGRGPAGP